MGEESSGKPMPGWRSARKHPHLRFRAAAALAADEKDLTDLREVYGAGEGGGEMEGRRSRRAWRRWGMVREGRGMRVEVEPISWR